MSTIKDNERMAADLRIVWQFDIEMNVPIVSSNGCGEVETIGTVREVRQKHVIAATEALARAAYDKQ